MAQEAEIYQSFGLKDLSGLGSDPARLGLPSGSRLSDYVILNKGGGSPMQVLKFPSIPDDLKKQEMCQVVCIPDGNGGKICIPMCGDGILTAN
ncbi:hypothetical protein [Rhizobium sp. NRK18]|uniref:hypothetical protein n=1 Tax=Rhizobium sp. NRK18 TaxID=2964667 RepID=UPI0021C33CA3|nr:hypothetical protein [Rhizobium sp. NRK18]MCQ2004828.1 hypothetical protein [Rhizobium sp. NRK18]